MFSPKRSVDFSSLNKKLHTDPERIALRQGLKLSDRERNRFLMQVVSSTRSGITVPNFVYGCFKSLADKQEKLGKMAYLMDDPPSNALMLYEFQDLVSNQGFQFHEACREFPKIFDQTTVVMLEACYKVGTYSGKVENGVYIPGLLEQHVKFLDKIVGVKQKIRGELIMPIFTLFVALIVIGILLKFVMPALKQMFEPLGEAVNPVTSSLLFFGGFVEVYWWLLILLGIGIPLGYRFLRDRDERVRRFESALALRIPVLNRVVVRLAAYQWVGIYKGMVSAGASQNAGLFAAAGIGNLGLQEAAISAANKAILDGRDISETLADSHPCFSRVTPLYSTLKKYEVSAQTEDLDNFERELERLVDSSIDELVRMIDPIMKIVLGLVVGYIVLGMYLPMIQLVGALAGAGK